jgi:hypothetical protein
MSPVRGAGAAFVGLAMVAALVAGTGPSAGRVTPVAAESSARGTEGTVERSAPRALLYWSGYRIDRTGKASGGWIGARRRGRDGPIIYRIDPAASARSTGYHDGRWVHRLRGKGPHRSGAGRKATSRAAWIVSKYGTYRYDVQSAAVDAALLRLLAQHRWTLRGALGAPRIRQTGEPTLVRKFARIMLDDSRRLAGPYTVRVRQKNVAVIGDPVQLAIRVVVARNGRPLPFVPVQLRTPDGVTDAGTTGEDGRVDVTYEEPVAGATSIEIRVSRVPETRLRVLAPRRKSASRVVIAGTKGPLTGHGVVYVKAWPRVAVTTDDSRIRKGSRTRGRFRLVDSAEAWPRTAAVSLHGPFSHRDNALCGVRTIRKGQRDVTAAGEYSLPRFTLHKVGYYVWRVDVPGNQVNLPAGDCGGRFRVVAP